MDLGGFFGGIGNFFENLFGGGDDQRKKQQQQQQQQQAPRPAAPSISFNMPSQAPPTVQMPQPFQIQPTQPNQTQPQAPKIGGIKMQAPNVSGLSPEDQQTVAHIQSLGKDPSAFIASAQNANKAQAQSNYDNSLVGKIGNFGTEVGKTLASAAQQGAGMLGDTALEGGRVLDDFGIQHNPFINNAQKNQQETQSGNTIDMLRSGLHGMHDATGAPISGVSGADQSGAKIANGSANIGDVANVGMTGLNTGLSATMFDPAAYSSILGKLGGVFRPAVADAEAVATNDAARAVEGEGAQANNNNNQQPTAVTSTQQAGKPAAITSANRPAPQVPAVKPGFQPLHGNGIDTTAGVPTDVAPSPNTPAYMNRTPTTVGQAQTQYNLTGRANVPDGVFDADANANAGTDLGATSNPSDVPAFQRKNADATISDAQARLEQLDQQIADLSNQGTNSGKFADKQAIASAYQDSPQKGQAVAKLIQGRGDRYDPEAAMKYLVSQRQQAATDLETAQRAKQAQAAIDASNSAESAAPQPEAAKAAPVETPTEAKAQAAAAQAAPVSPDAVAEEAKQAERDAPTESIANDVNSLSKAAKNSLENDTTGMKPGGVERSGGRVENGTAKPVEYRRLPDGSTVIVDGRHTLEYARQNSINDFPMKDVTADYEPKTADEIPVESAAKQATEPADDIEKDPNAVGSVNAFKKFFLSKTNAMRATNTDAGRELAGRIENAESRHTDLLGNYMSQLKNTFKLNPKDFEKAWRAQEGEIDPASLSPKVQKAVAELKTVMPQIQKDASAADAISGDLGDTYMPHVFAKGKGPTVKMPGEATTNARKYGNLEKERTSSATNYQRTPDVLKQYIDKSAQRIGQAEELGSKNEIAKDLVSKVGAQGGDQALVDKALAHYMSPPHDSTLVGTKLSKGVRTLQSALQLPLSFLSHSTQTANVAVDAGLRDAAKGLGKTLFGGKDAGALLDRSGVIAPQSLEHYSKEYTSFGGKLANKVTAPGLKPVMKFNRSVAAHAYASNADRLAAKGDIAGLRDLGVKGDIGPKLTDDQRLQAMRAGTKRTMFTNSAADTPVNAETPSGKAIWQYRGAYARPQTGFIYDRVLKPAAQGNLAPLARYATVGTAGAAAPVMAKNAIAGRPNDPASVAGTVIPEMGGLPGTSANSLVKYGPSNPDGTTLGLIAPILGEGDKVVKAIGASAKSGTPTALERYALSKIPVVGSQVAKAVVPTQAQQSAANNPGQQSSGNPVADFFSNMFGGSKPSDPATTELQRLTSDNGVKLTTAESNALKSKGINPLAQSLINDPMYQAADDQTKLSMFKSVLHGTATKGINNSLKAEDKQALLDYNVQNATDRKAWLDDNNNAKNYYTALYNNAVENKSINPQLDNDLANKSSLKYKMFAAQVDAKYNVDPETKANYASTTQSKFIAMLNPKSATYDPDAAKVLAQYDQERVDAGLPAKYNLDVVGKSLAKAAATGTKVPAAVKNFTFASMPSSLIGTKAGSGSGSNGGYAADTSLFTPLPALKAPVGAAIQPRTISISKVKQV